MQTFGKFIATLTLSFVMAAWIATPASAFTFTFDHAAGATSFDLFGLKTRTEAPKAESSQEPEGADLVAGPRAELDTTHEAQDKIVR